jgi:hypothetical protein
LSQVLNNLLGNAAKFTRQGCIRVSASWHDSQHQWVAVHVTDTGIGIPKQKLASIFLPFEQVRLKNDCADAAAHDAQAEGQVCVSLFCAHSSCFCRAAFYASLSVVHGAFASYMPARQCHLCELNMRHIPHILESQTCAAHVGS